MAIVFSKVNVISGEDKAEFMVSGIPKKLDNLRGWNIFEDFLKRLQKGSKAKVFATAYRYGEGEDFNATIHEIADIQQRLKSRINFLESSCIKITDIKFNFIWPQNMSIFDKIPFVEL